MAVSVHDGNVADSQTLMPEIKRLREDFGIEQLVMVGDRGMVSSKASSQDYPGERLVACRNPELAKLRAHKREELLVATEKSLAKIKARVDAAKLAGALQHRPGHRPVPGRAPRGEGRLCADTRRKPRQGGVFCASARGGLKALLSRYILRVYP